MNIDEVRKIVGKLRVNLFKKSQRGTVGLLKSKLKGTGLQFKEHQVYSFGDEIRFIDWKILAKTNHPYIKTFEEERNVEIVVVLDAGSTMFQGAKGVSKLQAAIEMTALLYLIAEESKDLVHVVIITDVITHVKKSSGEKGLSNFFKILNSLKILNENGKVQNVHKVQVAQNQAAETLSSGVQRVITQFSRSRKEVIVLSDFYELLTDKDLTSALALKHVNFFKILTPLDDAKKMPFYIFSQQGTSSGFGVYNLKMDILQQNKNLKVKQIKVHEPYLEKFIKEFVS